MHVIQAKHKNPQLKKYTKKIICLTRDPIFVNTSFTPFGEII